jgi:ATPase family associated with various cellular activities (AAA)
MPLAERLTEYVQACFTGIWVESHEHDDALAEIARLAHGEQWRLATWDIDRGLRLASDSARTGNEAGGGDPLAAIRALDALGADDGTALLVLVNFHKFLNSAEIIQALAHQISQGKQNRTFVIVLSPIVQLPIELEKLFVVVEHDLPNREQLADIARGVASEPGELSEETIEAVLDSAAGLTRYEAENAFALSLVRHRRIEPRVVFELKSQMLKKSGLLTLYEGHETFADLGGLAALKTFCLRSLRAGRHGEGRTRPRGVLLLSPPGCGKSAFAKSLGNETGRPTLVLDVGGLLGSLVGQSEQNVRQALRIADAMAPCVLYCDELEKALSGHNGQGDSGVSSRLFGTLLTYLNDHTSDVYFVGTSNDVSRLPPEFARAERFDGVFMVDLPGAREREIIWRMYVAKFGLPSDQKHPNDTDWTGAEIRSCCRLATLLDVPLIEAAKNVVPVAITAGESVERLRNWAAGRCLSADRPGVYTRGATSAIKPGRRVNRDPSNN